MHIGDEYHWLKIKVEDVMIFYFTAARGARVSGHQMDHQMIT